MNAIENVLDLVFFMIAPHILELTLWLYKKYFHLEYLSSKIHEEQYLDILNMSEEDLNRKR